MAPTHHPFHRCVPGQCPLPIPLPPREVQQNVVTSQHQLHFTMSGSCTNLGTLGHRGRLLRAQLPRDRAATGASNLDLGPTNWLAEPMALRSALGLSNQYIGSTRWPGHHLQQEAQRGHPVFLETPEILIRHLRTGNTSSRHSLDTWAYVGAASSRSISSLNLHVVLGHRCHFPDKQTEAR